MSETHKRDAAQAPSPADETVSDAVTHVLSDSATIAASSMEQATAPYAPMPRRARALSVRAGMVIDSAYQVLDVLGEGGMGVVLRALDLKLEREVAIKLVRPEHEGDADWRAHFVAEARAMAMVRHDNVITIHAFGELYGTPYFVMEHVRGVNLAALIRDGSAGRLSTYEVVSLMGQVADGVDAIHRAGAVHLDLKPSNILLGEGFRVVVTDLGIARMIRDRTGAGPRAAGTPSYMAPESAVRGDVSPATDVFSLGVMTYQLLTGRLPFGPIDDAAQVVAQTAAPPLPPSALNDELPAELDAPIMLALSAAPASRQVSASEYAAQLDTALAASLKRPEDVSILVVDDDPAMRELVELMLSVAFGHANITSAEDGPSALEAILRQPPSLLVTDLEMPGLDGLALTATLRGHPATRDLPIIVMTAVGGAAEWRKLSVLGANAFLVKPFDEKQLELAVRRLLDLSP